MTERLYNEVGYQSLESSPISRKRALSDPSVIGDGSSVKCQQQPITDN
ncbi:hypothetical protein [Coleofasciculus sp. FACHB-1120]|nr:hypothetical protein [Coleofasciculus sp. FACHB-1120]MBD2744398.1 hypothetical protein [Coleofasciculus sp. FACHB-1120]